MVLLKIHKKLNKIGSNKMEMQWHFLAPFAYLFSLSYEAFLRINIHLNVQQQCNVQALQHSTT